jgi:hypothetical protein
VGLDLPAHLSVCRDPAATNQLSIYSVAATRTRARLSLYLCISFSLFNQRARFERTMALFVSDSGSFWPPKAAADCQTFSFSVNFYKIRWAKTIQNQHKHIIGLVVVIVRIRHFLDHKPYEQLYLPPHVIVMILKFSPQSDSSYSHIFRKVGQKKLNQTDPMFGGGGGGTVV